jgi:small nuclear ribonucleoprotein (snRNP)-like protein
MRYEPLIHIDNKEVSSEVESFTVYPDKAEPAIMVNLTNGSTVKGRLTHIKHFDAQMRFHIATRTKKEILKKQLAESEKEVEVMLRNQTKIKGLIQSEPDED